VAAEPFDPEEFRAALAPRHVVALAETGSTNDEALRLGREGAPHGTVVVADAQTVGRGRLGRVWWAEPGTALLASWLVRPALPPESWPALSLVAGVAVAEVLREAASLNVSLKWPNDLLAGRRKIGGILAEAEPGRFVVIGLGLNVAQASFPPELAQSATSVAAAGGKPPPRPALLAAIIDRFDALPPDLSGTLARYRALCATLGRHVSVEMTGGKPIEGVARDVDERGALAIDTADGPRRVASGDVVHLH
jgi:BirA family biotin operon repressor/biotin-[acetyl-CoA-carboxylase] ligase